MHPPELRRGKGHGARELMTFGEQFFELSQGTGIGNVFGFEAGAAGLVDAPLHEVQGPGAVGIGIDDEGDAQIGGGAGVDVVEVEALGVGVDLQQDAMFLRGF